MHLWTNPGEIVLTPFMGVGSEVWSAVRSGRKGIGAELKPSYYRQAVKNMGSVDAADTEPGLLFEVPTTDLSEIVGEFAVDTAKEYEEGLKACIEAGITDPFRVRPS